MSIIYSGKSNTPIFKYAYALAPTTTFTIWSPASGKKVNITDAIFCNAAAGTMGIYYGSSDATVAQTPIFMFVLAGSSTVGLHLQTPIQVPTADYTIKAQTNFNGHVGITLSGYESM